MTEPFATLLDRNLLTDLAEERAGRRPAFVLADAPESVHEEAEGRSRPSAVLTNSFVCPSKTDKPDGGAVRLGLNMISFGAPGRIRTCGLGIRSPLLYPLSYGRVVARRGYRPRAGRPNG